MGRFFGLVAGLVFFAGCDDSHATLRPIAVDSTLIDNACESCDLGQVCQVGRCLAGRGQACQPLECGEGLVCNAQVCISDQADLCQRPTDCRWGYQCREGRCVSLLDRFDTASQQVLSCGSDGDCLSSAANMSCRLGVCLGCVDDAECAEVSAEHPRCVQSACVAELPAQLDCVIEGCTEGQICRPSTGQCEPRCEGDSDCGDGFCTGIGLCVERLGCRSSAECGLGLLCTNGLCVGCGEAADCPGAEACILNACIPNPLNSACEDVDCGEGLTCDPADGRCYASSGRCDDDDQCRVRQVCGIIGFCAGCDADSECRPGLQCLSGHCVPD